MRTLGQIQKTRLTNILRKTGRNQRELTSLIRNSGLTRQGELRTMVMRKLGLSYSDANALVQAVERSDGAARRKKEQAQAVLDELYKGTKAPLRPIHEAVMRQVNQFGEVEVVSMKGYVSLRRKKQFAMVGPAGSKRVDLKLNVKDLPPSRHLIEGPRGSEYNYLVKLTDPSQVDAEVTAWMKFAFEDAG